MSMESERDPSGARTRSPTPKAKPRRQWVLQGAAVLPGTATPVSRPLKGARRPGAQITSPVKAPVGIQSTLSPKHRTPLAALTLPDAANTPSAARQQLYRMAFAEMKHSPLATPCTAKETDSEHTRVGIDTFNSRPTRDRGDDRPDRYTV